MKIDRYLIEQNKPQAHNRLGQILDMVDGKYRRQLMKEQKEIQSYENVDPDEAFYLLSHIEPNLEIRLKRDIVRGIRSRFDRMTAFMLLETWFPDDKDGLQTWHFIETFNPKKHKHYYGRVIQEARLRGCSI